MWGVSLHCEESEGAEIKDGGQILKVSWNSRKKRQPLDSAFETETAEKGQQWTRERKDSLGLLQKRALPLCVAPSSCSDNSLMCVADSCWVCELLSKGFSFRLAVPISSTV